MSFRRRLAIAAFVCAGFTLATRSASPVYFTDDPLQVDNDRALDAGIFDDDADPDAEFRFGLERVLDGIGAAGGPSGRAASPAERESS